MGLKSTEICNWKTVNAARGNHYYNVYVISCSAYVCMCTCVCVCVCVCMHVCVYIKFCREGSYRLG